ncbi:hypothetical protein CH375_22830 [Leptospira ellisii]|nr:hypothetical protein CH375_22830 [Leptospira ellisii]
MSRKAVESSENDGARLKFQLHLAYLLRGDPPGKKEEAERIIRSVLEVQPAMSYARYLLGIVLASRDRFPEALKEFDAAIETDPENGTYYFYRASVFEKLDRQEEMEKDLKRSISIDPGNPMAYNYLGYYLSEKGVRLEESLTLVQKAVELAPDNEAYQDSLGWIFFKMGNHEEALLHLQLARYKDPFCSLQEARKSYISGADHTSFCVGISKARCAVRSANSYCCIP